MSLLVRVRRYAERHGMWRPTTRVVAAVSGGSDSVAMLRLLHELHSAGNLRLACVAHLNHQLRSEADADEAFCAELAERLGVPFVSSRSDVAALAREQKQSVEVAGRIARHAFLRGVRRSTGADRIATAHTQDDQAETVLLRLMRGAGQRGMAGIAPCRLRLIRPVLCATRAELCADLDARGQAWREDMTNADIANPRNRVRHELLPYLEAHFNPAIRKALARSADAVRADDALLARLAAAAAVGTVRQVDGSAAIDVEAFRCLPEAIRRRLALDLLASDHAHAPSHDVVSRFVDRMEHFDGKVVLVGRRPRRIPTPFDFALSVPGQIQTESGWVVQAEAFDNPQRRAAHPEVAQIDAATVAGGLFVRNRRPGDRLRPLGLGGSKKLQDVLVDRKVRREERDALPIVTDAAGRIVWVAGHVLDEEFRVTAHTKGVIILKLRRI